MLDWSKKEVREAFWHASSHVLADAVKRLWPDAKLGIGPPIEQGFYYDFDLKHRLVPEDLRAIEAQMAKIIAEDFKFEHVWLSRKEAEKLLKNEPYKLELLREIKGDKISFYKHGNFIDLCSGPLIERTGQIKAFKLLNIAGAYWRGDESRPMLQRIYGISFPSKSQLEQFLKQREEALKRDHRELGAMLDLFQISPEVGAGLIIWHPKGAIIRQQIERFWLEQHAMRGYQYVYTPHIAKLDLWKKSGHWKFYRQDMWPPMSADSVQYELKPMNCVFHIQIFKSKKRSYRELPIRYAELGTVYRYERGGTLHGLTRVRGFTQDDAHIFCMPDQLQKEIESVLDLSLFMLRTFGFKEFKIELSVRDPKQKQKYMGSDQLWERAEHALRAALERANLKFEVAEGEAVFYGPKIDLHLIDAFGRKWQCTTIQVDFNLPEKFNLIYVGQDNREHPVVMVHRTILGSLERFTGVLLEHYGGNLPLWLAPIQARVLSFTDRNVSYAKEVLDQLRAAGIRADEDFSASTIQYKVRQAELEKIPYILVCGDKEQANKTIAVRKHGVRGVKFGIKLNEFVKDLLAEIESKQP